MSLRFVVSALAVVSGAPPIALAKWQESARVYTLGVHSQRSYFVGNATALCHNASFPSFAVTVYPSESLDPFRLHSEGGKTFYVLQSRHEDRLKSHYDVWRFDPEGGRQRLLLHRVALPDGTQALEAPFHVLEGVQGSLEPFIMRGPHQGDGRFLADEPRYENAETNMSARLGKPNIDGSATFLQEVIDDRHLQSIEGAIQTSETEGPIIGELDPWGVMFAKDGSVVLIVGKKGTTAVALDAVLYDAQQVSREGNGPAFEFWPHTPEPRSRTPWASMPDDSLYRGGPH